jgi:hypothetical protein
MGNIHVEGWIAEFPAQLRHTYFKKEKFWCGSAKVTDVGMSVDKTTLVCACCRESLSLSIHTAVLDSQIPNKNGKTDEVLCDSVTTRETPTRSLEHSINSYRVELFLPPCGRLLH